VRLEPFARPHWGSSMNNYTRRSRWSFVCLLIIAQFGCGGNPPTPSPGSSTGPGLSQDFPVGDHVVGVQTEPLGETPDGEDVVQYVLTNSAGMKVRLINIGASVTAIDVPDKNGKFANVALGF